MDILNCCLAFLAQLSKRGSGLRSKSQGKFALAIYLFFYGRVVKEL